MEETYGNYLQHNLNPPSFLNLQNFVYIFVSALNLLKIVCVIYFIVFYDFCLFFFPRWILIYENCCRARPACVFGMSEIESFRCPPSPVCIYCVIGMRGTHSSQFYFLFFKPIFWTPPKNYFFVDVE